MTAAVGRVLRDVALFQFEFCGVAGGQDTVQRRMGVYARDELTVAQFSLVQQPRRPVLVLLFICLSHGIEAYRIWMPLEHCLVHSFFQLKNMRLLQSFKSFADRVLKLITAKYEIVPTNEILKTMCKT